MLSREKSQYADSSTFISVSHLVYSDLIIQEFQTYLRNRRASLPLSTFSHEFLMLSSPRLTAVVLVEKSHFLTFPQKMYFISFS